jgi:anthranilate synthase component II
VQDKLLILDNYDSFTYNLFHLAEKVSDLPIDVRKNDRIKLDEVQEYSRIILSPGPGLPSEAGIMPELLKKYRNEIPILGVCLGFQAIGECFGMKLRNLGSVCHGMSKQVFVKKQDILFKGCPDTFNAGRYHSWVIDEKSLNGKLEVTAVDGDGLIMAGRHPTLNLRGVQFHPESILSEHGERMMRNWLSRG